MTNRPARDPVHDPVHDPFNLYNQNIFYNVKKIRDKTL